MQTFIERLELKVPVWNAGMGGGLAGAEMAAAVSNGGGLGVLGTGGGMPPPAIIDMVQQTRALTSRPIGANIILPMSDGSDIEAVFDAGVEVLVLFWGDPQPFIADARKRGMFVVAQCAEGDDAVAAADAGVDGVIVQGTEAGGHVKATARLADSMSQTVPALGAVPLIAAGGLSSGGDVRRALDAGAAAVSMGTRFLASHESKALGPYKQRVVDGRAADTVMTKLFDIGWPDANHRVLRNSTYDAWEKAGAPASGTRPGEGDTIATFGAGADAVDLPRYSVLPPAEGFEGDIEAAPLYAGESVDAISTIDGCDAIMARLLAELREASQ